MKSKLLLLSAAMACTMATSAFAMTKEEHSAEKTRISADYKAGKQKCDALKDNAKDICMSEVKGAEKVAKAELESTYKPSARNTQKVSLVKADATYDMGKEKCDDLSGDPKNACVKEAKAVHAKAKSDAKTAMATAPKS